MENAPPPNQDTSSSANAEPLYPTVGVLPYHSPEPRPPRVRMLAICSVALTLLGPFPGGLICHALERMGVRDERLFQRLLLTAFGLTEGAGLALGIRARILHARVYSGRYPWLATAGICIGSAGILMVLVNLVMR